jgi:hypothetical protein
VLACSLLLLGVVMLSLDGLVLSACILCLVLVIVIMNMYMTSNVNFSMLEKRGP